MGNMTRENFKALADGIAAHYGMETDSKRFDSMGWNSIRMGSETMSAWMCEREGKTSFHVEYPKTITGGQPYDVKQSSISFTASKGLEKILKDIDRRLMPEYRNEYARVKEWIDAQNKHIETRHAALVKAANMLGSNGEGIKKEDDRFYSYAEYIRGDVYCGVENGAPYYNIELRGVSIEQLKAIKSIVEK